jgi:hypothetical protein
MVRAKKKMRTRTVAVLIGIGVAVVGGGIAFAYFTNVGSGTGGATAGSNNPVTVNQVGTLAGIAPGVSVALAGTFTNPNPGPVQIKSVTATLAPGAITKAAGAVGTCDVSDFQIVNTATPAVPPTQTATTLTGPDPGVQVASGSNVGAWSGLTLQFNNKTGVNQDGCKGAGVVITYTAA